MSDLAVRTVGLTKFFGSQKAVADLDLKVPTGAVYGFLGPNGSGKTTTIRMLLGLVRPTSGTCHLLGHPVPDDVRHALPRVGTLVEGPAFHPYLSARANLHRLDAADARTSRRTADDRIGAALDRVGLTPAGDKRFRAYSLGMKQRLAIAAALLTPRELLVLDEPTNGLDPQGTREVRHLVGSLADEGITVLVSSHLLSEVEQICSHIGVMRAGRLVAQSSVVDLRAAQQVTYVVRTGDRELAGRVLRDERLAEVDSAPGGVQGQPSVGGPEAHRVVAALVGAGVRVEEFVVQRPSLEDVYVGLTGEGFDVRG